MAYIRREGENKVTWVIEKSGGTLAEQVSELAVIFDYYAGRKESINDDFVMQLLAMQAKALSYMAKSEEAQLRQLQKLNGDVARLQEELAEMKSPKSLEKKKLPAPKGDSPK